LRKIFANYFGEGGMFLNSKFSKPILKAFTVLLSFVLLIGGSLAVPSPDAASAAVGPITVSLTETPEAFKNPFKGFRPTRFMDDSGFSNHEYGTVFKHYIKYTDLENAASDSVQKIKDWSNTAWAGIESQNKKVIPRVFIVYPNGGEYWPQGVPHGDAATQWTTDTLKNRLTAFIQKLGQAWDNDPRVAYIELGLWGNWGEHHIWPDKLADGTDRIPLSFQTALGDAAAQAFQNKKVQVRYPDTFQNYSFGFLWDSFALIDDLAGGEGIVARDVWRTQVNGGEVAYDWGQKHIQPGDSPNDTLSDPGHRNYVIDWIKKTHTTSLGWIDLYDAGNSSVSQGAALMQKELGYRFVINQATFSGSVQPGGALNVSFQVANKGSAPFYYDWPVEASLLRSDRTVAWKGIFNNADIRNWMPGDNWNSTTRQYNQAPAVQQVSGEFDIPSNMPAGTYTLALSILDPYGYKPSARFANTNYYTGGRTPLGKVGIGMDPANQSIGPFDNLKPDNTLSYSLNQTPYDGGYSGEGTTTADYEAEAAANTRTGAAVISACVSCSGGSKVGFVGNNDGTLQFNGISAAAAGTYTMTISYISGEARSAQLRVNGGTPATLNLLSTGSWTAVGTVQTQVQLNAGHNTIHFSNPTGWAPDFDRIQISGGVSTGGGGTNSLLVDNFDNSPGWPGTNDLGKWTGANGFVNQAGVIDSGALKLEYNNDGWLGSEISQNIGSYSKLVIRIKGANGGEQNHFQLTIGGVTKTMAAFSGDTITTGYKDLEIDLVANSSIWIDEIRFG
jgi:hypothetical protein